MKRTGEEKLSRHLSFLLRHSPEFVDSSGWASISSVMTTLSIKAGAPVSEQEVREIVRQDSKGRYEIHGARIRAVQGHSHSVDLGWEAKEPPALLLHGTVERFVPAILAQGLRPQSRTHVHLSEGLETATQVAARRSGETVLLVIDAESAFASGVEFFQAKNGVWLATAIPPQFISQK